MKLVKTQYLSLLFHAAYFLLNAIILVISSNCVPDFPVLYFCPFLPKIRHFHHECFFRFTIKLLKSVYHPISRPNSSTLDLISSACYICFKISLVKSARGKPSLGSQKVSIICCHVLRNFC